MPSQLCAFNMIEEIAELVPSAARNLFYIDV